MKLIPCPQAAYVPGTSLSLCFLWLRSSATPSLSHSSRMQDSFTRQAHTATEGRAHDEMLAVTGPDRSVAAVLGSWGGAKGSHSGKSETALSTNTSIPVGLPITPIP